MLCLLCNYNFSVKLILNKNYKIKTSFLSIYSNSNFADFYPDDLQLFCKKKYWTGCLSSRMEEDVRGDGILARYRVHFIIEHKNLM